MLQPEDTGSYMEELFNTTLFIDYPIDKISVEFLGLFDTVISQMLEKKGIIDAAENFYDFLDMDRTVTQVEAKRKHIKLQNVKGRDVLTNSDNWKNICQGGATPSFNVFIGNEFYHND